MRFPAAAAGVRAVVVARMVAPSRAPTDVRLFMRFLHASGDGSAASRVQGRRLGRDPPTRAGNCGRADARVRHPRAARTWAPPRACGQPCRWRSRVIGSRMCRPGAGFGTRRPPTPGRARRRASRRGGGSDDGAKRAGGSDRRAHRHGGRRRAPAPGPAATEGSRVDVMAQRRTRSPARGPPAGINPVRPCRRTTPARVGTITAKPISPSTPVRPSSTSATRPAPTS